MSKFEESNFYKALQDFFINADKKTFLQFLAEFYNRTEGIINKDNIQDDLIKELRELYLEFNEKGIDENIVREKVNYFLENSLKIKDIISKLTTNTNNIENINSQLDTKTNIKNNVKVINVNEYGIKTDGTVYNSINLENIIMENVCTYFSNVGDYLFNNITLSNKNNIIINGDNSNIIFKSTSQFSNCNNLTFKNINFINRNNIYQVLLFSNCSNIKFTNCTINGESLCKNGVTFESCSNIQIYDTTVKNINERFGFAFMNCEEIKVNNCYFENIGGPAITFKWGNNGCYVHNSIFKNCCNYNWSSNSGTDGVIDFYGPYDTYGKNRNGLISENRIKGFGLSNVATTGIRVISSDYITVKNNIISGGIGNCTYLTIGDRKRASDGVLFDSIGCNLLNNTLILDNSVNMFIDISGKVSSCDVKGNKILNNGGSVINEWNASIRITQTTESSNCVNIENNCLGNENSRLPLSGIIIGKANVNTTIKNNYIYTLHTPLSITTGTGVIVEGNWFGSEVNDSVVNNVTNGIIKNNIRCFNRTFNTESNTNVLVGDTLDNF